MSSPRMDLPNTAGLSPLLSLRQVFDPRIRSLLWQSVTLAIICAVALYFALRAAFNQIIGYSGPAVLGITFDIITGFVALFGFVYILAPVSAIIANFNQDKIANWIEYEHYGPDGVGQAPSFLETAKTTLNFTATVIVANILLLLIAPIPIVNVVAFFIVNGYLLGREYFEFAAMRYCDRGTARELRRKNSFMVFLGGAMISAILVVPFANLTTPIFGTILMIHLVKKFVPHGAMPNTR